MLLLLFADAAIDAAATAAERWLRAAASAASRSERKGGVPVDVLPATDEFVKRRVRPAAVVVAPDDAAAVDPPPPLP